jgi:serine/threonine protein kinase
MTAPPTILANRYQLERLLGKGGGARVFLATDTVTGQRIALRVCRFPLRRPRSNMDFQFDLLSQLHDKGIVRMLAVGRLDNGHAYGVFEYLHGDGLDKTIASRPLGLADALTVGVSLARCLGVVHAARAIHRDVKPANVILPTDNGVVRYDHPVLIDFGAYAWLTEHHAGQPATDIGNVSGTPAYMAPEQFTGRRESVATDIYGLAALLYELVFRQQLSAGQEVWLSEPIAGSERAFFGDLVTRRIGEEIVLPAAPFAPDSVRLCLQRALRIRPAERHCSMAEFGAELADTLRECKALQYDPQR